MPEVPTILDRSQRFVRRLVAGVRPHHLAVMLAVAAVAAGLLGIRQLAMPGPRPVTDAERMRIQVVAPTEPQITAGPVMDVGALVDMLEALPKPAEVETVDYLPHDEDFEPEPSRPQPRRAFEDAVIQVPLQPEMTEPQRGDERSGSWFGFDGPERDYRAEREERRARREARSDRERDRREVRRYYSDGDGRRDSRTWSDGQRFDRRD